MSKSELSVMEKTTSHINIQYKPYTTVDVILVMIVKHNYCLRSALASAKYHRRISRCYMCSVGS